MATADSQWLFEPRRFSGVVTIDETQIEIGFSLSADLTGELQFDVDPLPINQKTFKLLNSMMRVGERVSEFAIEAMSEDGWTVKSDAIFLGNTTNKTDRTGGATLHVGLRSRTAVLSHPREGDHADSRLVFRLKGFAGYGPLTVSHRLGSITAVGATRTKKYDEVTGFIALASTMETATAAWRAEAEKCLIHVNHVLGFARGAPLRVPIVEHYSPQQIELTFNSAGNGCQSFLPPFNDLHLQPILETAVSSFDKRDDRSDVLDLAIGWFIVPSTYDAIRYLSAMTALESLVQDDDASSLRTTILKPDRFKELRREISLVIDSARDLSEGERKNLKDKLGDLNRLSFREKLQRLAAAWGVPVDDLPPDIFRSLINIRNDIVHRGEWRYDGDQDIWEHLIHLRELVTRFILAALGFDGRYQSYLDGGEMKQFILAGTPRNEP